MVVGYDGVIVVWMVGMIGGVGGVWKFEGGGGWVVCFFNRFVIVLWFDVYVFWGVGEGFIFLLILFVVFVEFLLFVFRVWVGSVVFVVVGIGL